MNKELSVAITSAKKGGKVLMKYFRKKFIVEEKNDGTPVTIADKKSEEVIIKNIKKTFPFHAFWGEESGEHGRSEYVWIIDPLDGTKSFARGLRDFGISIALQKKGDIVLGVVYLPATNELYTAEKGKGAFKGGKRIFSSKIDTLDKSMVYLDTNRKKWEADDLWDKGSSLMKKTEIIRSENGTNKLMYVAEGIAEAYVGLGLEPWDVAAAGLIIKEAGGTLTDFSGKETILLNRCISSNGRVQKEILNILGGKNNNVEN